MWNQRKLSKFIGKKIITLDNASKNSFAFDDSGYLGTTTTYSLIPQGIAIKYLLGILNSTALSFYHKQITIPQSGGYYRYQAIFINNLPILTATPEQQQPIIDLVNRILVAKQSNPQTNTSDLETRIYELVYQLYGLTEDEIRIIEG